MENDQDKPISKENLDWLVDMAEVDKQRVIERQFVVQRRREIIDYLESKGYSRPVIYRVLNRVLFH